MVERRLRRSNPKFKPMIVTEVVVIVIGAFPLADCAETKTGRCQNAVGKFRLQMLKRPTNTQLQLELHSHPGHVMETVITKSTEMSGGGGP